MAQPATFALIPIGHVRSVLVRRQDAPKQGREGGPEAEIDVLPEFVPALHGLAAGQDLLVLTWLHQADRSTLETHPRDDRRRPLAGVFATRSPDRPNPIGVHRVRLLAIADGRRLRVADLTPQLTWVEHAICSNGHTLCPFPTNQRTDGSSTQVN